MNQNHYRRPQSLWGQSIIGTMVGRIILANIIIFAIQNIVPSINSIFALYPRMVVEKFMIWQLFSYMFLHGGVMHRDNLLLSADFPGPARQTIEEHLEPGVTAIYFNGA